MSTENGDITHFAAPRPRAAAIWLFVLAATAGLTGYYMLGAGTTLLTEPDEARCALIARHMVTSGDWLAPRLLDRPYFAKPPLYFWMLAASVRAFGENEWALRLPSAIIGAATVVLTGLLAWHLFSAAAGLIAAGTFAVSIAGLMAARVVRMDMLLALWVTGSLLCWLRASLPVSVVESPSCAAPTPDARRPTPDTRHPTSDTRHPAPDTRHPTPDTRHPTPDTRHPTPDTRHPTPDIRHPTPDTRHPTPDTRAPASALWCVAMYGCMSLGCLTKGPVAILLPAMVIGLYTLLSRPIRDIPHEIRRLRPLSGLAIIVLTYGSWVAYMTWRYHEYPREFFWRQNIDRFAGTGLDAAAPWWLIPGAFIGGLMPWTAMVALASWDRRPRRGIPRSEKLLWIWGLTVLVFFTLSRARLPNYVLPAFPSTFALLGGYLAAAGERHRTRLLIGALTTTAIGVAGVIAWAVAEHQRFEHADYPRAAVRLGALLAAIAPTWWLWNRRPGLALLPFFIAHLAITVEFSHGPAQQYFASRCTKDLAAPLASLDPAAAGEIVMATEPRYGAVFYAPPGWRFRVVETTQLAQLLPALEAGNRPLYAILTGGGLLRALRQDEIRDVGVSDRLEILQRWDSDAFVRIAPPALRKEISGPPAPPPQEISQPR